MRCCAFHGRVRQCVSAASWAAHLGQRSTQHAHQRSTGPQHTHQCSTRRCAPTQRGATAHAEGATHLVEPGVLLQQLHPVGVLPHLCHVDGQVQPKQALHRCLWGQKRARVCVCVCWWWWWWWWWGAHTRARARVCVCARARVCVCVGGEGWPQRARGATVMTARASALHCSTNLVAAERTRCWLFCRGTHAHTHAHTHL
jgi:hypothetical protein